MKLTLEIELQPNMEQLLIDKINEYCQDWFGKKPVLKQYDVSGSLPFKRYDVEFGNHLMAGIETNGALKFVGAVNGWGDGVPLSDIRITEVERQ